MSGLDVVKRMGGVVACKAVDTAFKFDSASIVMSNSNMIKDVALSGVKEGTEEVAKKKGLAEAFQYIFEPLKDSPIAAASALTVACEGVPFVMDSGKAVYRLRQGAITGRDCITSVAKSGTKAVCSGVGSMLGAGIGQMVIPMPILGAVVGGTIGNFLGRCTARGIPFP